MKIELCYGKGFLNVELPDRNFSAVFRKSEMIPVVDPVRAALDSLAAPVGSPRLKEIAAGKKTACIVVNDITRPVPNSLILPPILDELKEAGLLKENIIILNATGTHRPNEGKEISELIGDEIASEYKFFNHDCFNDEQHRKVGVTHGGTEIFIDTRYLDSDVKILTGLIEPHFMAGYSGGRKVLCPGIASIKTIRRIHSPLFMEDPDSTNCELDRNPLHKELIEIASMVGVDFIVNVIINERRELCGVFSGHFDEAHREGVSFSMGFDMIQAGERTDVVVTTSAGYPLDKTYYQAIKGMVGALGVVKQGGAIIIASECSEGLGNKTFVDCLKEFGSIGSIEEYIKHISNMDNFTPDQWQAEKLLEALKFAKVILVSGGLSDEELLLTLVETAPSVEEAVGRCLQRYGDDCSISVIPEGPYVIPMVEKKNK